MPAPSPRGKTSPPPVFAVLLAVAACLAFPTRALAQSAGAPGAGDAPVTSSAGIELRVVPTANSFRWVFAVSNPSTTQTPHVAADRRLLWAEILPSETASTAPGASPASPAAPAGRGRRRAPPRRVRCVDSNRPTGTENVRRLRLAPGTEYREGFDLRDLCGVRMPAALVPGARLLFHYGYEPSTRTARAVVFDEHTPITELHAAAPVEMPAWDGGWPPTEPAETGADERLELTVRGSVSVSDATLLTAQVRLRRPSRYPLWTFYRPGMIGFEVTTPWAARYLCTSGVREYVPTRDFFVRLGGGRVVSYSVRLAQVCLPDAFVRAGTYRARAIYTSRIDGRGFGLHAFAGRIRSQPFYFRVTRDRGFLQYAELSTVDPFEIRPAAGADASANTVRR